jgi:hypothetical protein
LALARGYAVAAVTSADRLSGCWQSSVDGPRVVRALSWLRGSEAWATDLPLFALGASSGGRFVASLPKLLLLQAAVCARSPPPVAQLTCAKLRWKLLREYVQVTRHKEHLYPEQAPDVGLRTQGVHPRQAGKLRYHADERNSGYPLGSSWEG